MEGVVDSITREIYSKIGGYDHFVTEFIRVSQQVLPQNVFYKYCPELKTNGRTKYGHPVFLQLLGGNPTLIAENAQKAESLGALGIDLNFGCPAKTVNRNDGGSTLLKNPHRLYDVISSVKKQVQIPVTAKVRLGFEDKSLVTEIAQAVNEAKASSITIHARTKLEAYTPPAHWEYIAIMKEVLTIPVLANGDIWSLEDYKNCKKISGCHNVALGRSAIAKPDLALEIKAYTYAQVHKHYTWKNVYNLLLEFIELSLALKGEKFCLPRVKQWTKFLARTYPESLDFFESIKQIKKYSEFECFLTKSSHNANYAQLKTWQQSERLDQNRTS